MCVFNIFEIPKTLKFARERKEELIYLNKIKLSNVGSKFKRINIFNLYIYTVILGSKWLKSQFLFTKNKLENI